LAERGDEARAMGDLREFADDQLLRRSRIKVGRDPRGIILHRIEIRIIAMVPDLDIRMIDHAVEMDRRRVNLAGRQG
jgi:hypothetical protein